MNLLRRLRAKKKYRTRQKRYKAAGKRQLNYWLPEGVGIAIDVWYEKLGVSKVVFVEHCFQIAFFHLLKINADTKALSMLQDHLIRFHIQNIGERDSEKILKLGCERTYMETFIPLMARVNNSLTLVNKELDAIINKHCTPEESDRIKKLNNTKDEAIFELAMWVKGFEVRMDSEKREPPVNDLP